MARIAKKVNNKLFLGIVQDEEGRIIKIFTGNSYDNVWLQSNTEAKAARGYWCIWDQFKRQIDGNYKAVHIV